MTSANVCFSGICTHEFRIKIASQRSMSRSEPLEEIPGELAGLEASDSRKRKTWTLGIPNNKTLMSLMDPKYDKSKSRYDAIKVDQAIALFREHEQRFGKTFSKTKFSKSKELKQIFDESIIVISATQPPRAMNAHIQNGGRSSPSSIRPSNKTMPEAQMGKMEIDTADTDFNALLLSARRFPRDAWRVTAASCSAEKTVADNSSTLADSVQDAINSFSNMTSKLPFLAEQIQEVVRTFIMINSGWK